MESAAGGEAAQRAPSLWEQPGRTAASVLLLESGLPGPGMSCTLPSYPGLPPDAQSTSDLELERTGVNVSLKTYLKLVLFLRGGAGG